MKPQYDAIASGYKQIIATLPERQLFGWNLELHEGDVTGSAVLDLACGTGDYTRRYKLRGAARVTGVDVSSRMIDMARQAEAEQPLGIEYLTADVAELGVIGRFDLITAFALLHYAPTPEHLYKMCRSIHHNLAPGARFVTVNKNILDPARYISNPEAWQRYNVRPGSAHGGLPKEGDLMRTHLHWNGAHVQFENYFFTQATYEKALTAAGFVDIRWHELVLPEEFLRQHGDRDHWQYMIDHAYMVILEAK